jgi:thioredoxin-related protein
MAHACLHLLAWFLVAACSAQLACAAGPDAETDLEKAFQTAKTDQKLLFVLYGREACGNCQALRRMVADRSVRLPDKEYVYADVSCDNPKQSATFYKAFKVEGSMLPFVAIADPDGKQLASRSGYGSADDFEALLRQARKALPKPERSAPKSLRSMAASAPPPGLKDGVERELRTWTARNGSQISARATREAAPFIYLRRADGTNLVIRLDSVSADDQAYVIARRQAEAAAATP